MENKDVDFHGGNIYKIFREKKINKILDFSSNINPLGVPENLKKAICSNFEVLERYPDPEYMELRYEIAKFNKLKTENIVVGNGATEIIFLFTKVLDLQKVLIVAPTFGEYERAIKSVKFSLSSEMINNFNKNKKEKVLLEKRIEIEYFELKEENEFVLDVKRLLEALDNDYDLLILCNPNNPTGKFVELEKMEKILKKCNEKGTKFLVDEAFIEFLENWEKKSIVYTKESKKNLFVIRAFTKFFAIPGLRLGYGICFDDKILEKMKNVKEPWSVNNFSEIAGKILLNDKEYIKKTNEWIKKEKKYMFEKLSKIKGITPFESEVNFILVRIDKKSERMNSKILQEKMLEKEILIRDASNFEFLDERFFRLAVKDRCGNLRVIESLGEIF